MLKDVEKCAEVLFNTINKAFNSVGGAEAHFSLCEFSARNFVQINYS